MLNFDDLLTKYTLTGFVLVLFCCILFLKAYIGKKSPSDFSLSFWGALFLALLVFMRLPFLAYNHELEVDESQMLAQALSMKKYWVYWKYVDGTTQGPLTMYFLIIPTLLGMPFDYVTARLVGFIVLLIVLWLTYDTLQNFFSRKVSLIVFAPIGLFYVLSQGYFSALCNEYFVLLLLAVGFRQFSVLYKQHKPSGRLLFLIAFVAGMVPFAKLQGVPTALLTVAFTALLVFLRSDRKVRDLIILALGGLTFPVIVFALAFYSGIFEYFWEFYLIGNVQYSGGGTMLTKLLGFAKFLRYSGQFIVLFLSYALLLGAAVWMLIRSGTIGKTFSLLFFFSFFHVGIAFYSVIKSGYYFQHYLQFLMIPIALLAGVLLEAGLRQQTWSRRSIWISSSVWLAICILPHFVYKITTTMGYTATNTGLISIEDLGRPLQISAVSKEILKYAQPGDDVTIWGWKPAYHLETRTAQGTADVMIYRIMTPSRMQESYFQKYLKDLRRSKPIVFVDEITTKSLWFNEPAKYRHENFPEIRDYVAEHYHHVSTVNGEKIYVRKDRLIPGKELSVQKNQSL